MKKSAVNDSFLDIMRKINAKFCKLSCILRLIFMHFQGIIPYVNENQIIQGFETI